MRHFTLTLLIFIIALTGCKPKAEIVTASGPYTLLSDPWAKYITSPPKLFLVPKMSPGLDEIFSEEQVMALAVLSGNDKIDDRPEYITIEEELEMLKSAVPGVETRTAHRQKRYYSSRAKASVSTTSNSQYASIRSGGSRYSAVFSQVHKTSSPDLARSVENLVSNVSLVGLQQRIDGLRQLISTWSKRTAMMNTSGLDGAIRGANLAYLSALKEYASDFEGLESRRQDVHKSLVNAKLKRAEILVDWEKFENVKLPILHDYVQQHSRHVVERNNSDQYLLPSHEAGDVLILGCEIGDRIIYFDLSGDVSEMHPFRLINIGS